MRVQAPFKLSLLLAFAPFSQPVFANPILGNVQVQAQREALGAASVRVAEEKLAQTPGVRLLWGLKILKLARL